MKWNGVFAVKVNFFFLASTCFLSCLIFTQYFVNKTLVQWLRPLGTQYENLWRTQGTSLVNEFQRGLCAETNIYCCVYLSMSSRPQVFLSFCLILILTRGDKFFDSSLRVCLAPILVIHFAALCHNWNRDQKKKRKEKKTHENWHGICAHASWAS